MNATPKPGTSVNKTGADRAHIGSHRVMPPLSFIRTRFAGLIGTIRPIERLRPIHDHHGFKIFHTKGLSGSVKLLGVGLADVCTSRRQNYRDAIRGQTFYKMPEPR